MRATLAGFILATLALPAGFIYIQLYEIYAASGLNFVCVAPVPPRLCFVLAFAPASPLLLSLAGLAACAMFAGWHRNRLSLLAGALACAGSWIIAIWFVLAGPLPPAA